MKVITQFTLLFILLITFLLVSGCSSVDCFKDINYQDYLGNSYKLVPGKHLGIMHGDDLSYDLIEQFGFDGVFGYPQYEISEDLHSRFPNSMAAIYSDLWKYYIDNFDYKYYYIDEWFENDYDETGVTPSLVELVEYIKEKRPESKFIIGGIRYILSDDYTHIPGLNYMYTRYECDQTDEWRGLRAKFGNNFFSSWVYGGSKIFSWGDEYCNLFKTANELGLSELWLYFGGNNQTKSEAEEHLVQFMLAAEKYGWVIKQNM